MLQNDPWRWARRVGKDAQTRGRAEAGDFLDERRGDVRLGRTRSAARFPEYYQPDRAGGRGGAGRVVLASAPHEHDGITKLLIRSGGTARGRAGPLTDVESLSALPHRGAG
jgi:hypothetical protein